MNTQTTHIQTEKQLVPQLRFAEFDDLWSEIKYGEIFSFYSTNSFSRDNLNYDDGKVKNIHYGDIHTKFSTMFNIEEESVPYINEDIDITRIKEESYCKEGDLVIADASEDYNDIGKSIELINLNNEKLLAGLHTFLARPDKYEIAKGFPGYLVQSWKVRKQVMTIAQGTKVLGLATSRLGKIKINLPTLPEQQKIASFLTAVDTKLQQLTQKKELLQQYKKGVMQQLFSQQIRFKKEDGSDYPDWEEKKLGDFCTFFSGGTPKSTNKEYYSGDIPFIGSGDIYDSNVDSFISEKALNNSSAKIVNVGDLLYALYGANSGELAISQIEGAINQAILCIRSKENINYIYYLLFYKKDRIVAKFLQGGQGNLSSKIIKNLNYKFPSKGEQQYIAGYLAALDTKIETVTQQIETTQQFKKGLLQQMFV